jgi:hypothetical protein
VLEVAPGALGKEPGINEFTENAESLFVLVKHRAAIGAPTAVSGKTDTILRLRGAYRGVKRVTRGSVNRTPIWYELRALLAAADQVFLFPDGWIAIVYGDPYHVEWIPPTNARLRGPNLQLEQIAVEEEEKRAAIGRRYDTEAFSPSDFPAWPRYLPAFLDDALVAIPDGRIAVRRTTSVKDRHVFYDIIDRRGMRTARLRLEANEHIVGFGKQSVYVALREADDLEWLSRYPWPPR